jgi:hypothetical protein
MESRLAGTIGPVEVYRVHHHGSSHSSNACFVQVLEPLVSVVSSGKNNYGHPDPEVYARLLQYGDVRITADADRSVRARVANDIVGGDVEVLVAPDGARFWVNGKPYQSRTEAEETASPSYRASCEDTLGKRPASETYKPQEADVPTD